MRNSKRIKIVAGGTAVLMGGGIAFAYWTTTGDGTGTSTNASSNGTIVLHADWADGLTPGGDEDVSFTADNAGTSNLRVGTIHLESVAVDSGHSACDVADFSMADVPSNTTVPAGASAFVITGTGTLVFADSVTKNQDECQGADITLHLSSN
jgi:hypothetical protein